MSFLKPKLHHSSAPLSALNLVVFDTETTGLNVHKDRVIEIGAVRITGGHIDTDNSFQQLINPGIAIPPTSNRIHGISDQDISDAPNFADAFSDFSKWVGDVPVVGFMLGFDLGILKAEHQRHQRKWIEPRWLDIDHLIGLIGSSLPDYSLETIASWLGIEVSNRHRALADAQITAEIFLAILPRLRDRGVSSFAQAERASITIAERRAPPVEAGWSEKRLPASAEVRALTLIDSFPYRHKVAEVMSDKPLTSPNNISAHKALSLLMKHKTSSIFYLLDTRDQRGNKLVGICTERDLLRALDTHGDAALSMPINKIGCEPLISIHKDEYLYRAMGLMTTKRLRHLGVIDDAGKIIGAVTSRDLLSQRSGDTVNLGQRIMQAQNAAELGSVWSALVPAVQTLVHESIDARDIASLISSELRNLTSRACELSILAMQQAGKGDPPCPYALLVLGSGGRGESLLAMDQDNALIYAPQNNSQQQQIDDWFAELGSNIAGILDTAGVPYCKGGVMASNANWRKPLNDWYSTTNAWIARASNQDFLQCDIFFDAACVHGEAHLAEQLLNHARNQAAESQTFLKFLALKCGQFDPSINLLGRFKLSDGRLDCKLNGIMPVFSVARLLALRHRISAHSTPERLHQAQAYEPNHHDSCANLIQVHHILLEAILEQQLQDLDKGIKLSNRVDTSKLSNYQKQQLRWALEHVAEVKNLLEIPVL